MIKLILAVFMLTGTLINGQRCQKDLIAERLQVSPDHVGALQGVCERCMTQHDVTQEELAAIERGEATNPSDGAMCYFGCYGLAVGTINERNEVNYVELRNFMTPEHIRLVEQCEPAMEGKEGCRGFYELYACFVRASRN